MKFSPARFFSNIKTKIYKKDALGKNLPNNQSDKQNSPLQLERFSTPEDSGSNVFKPTNSIKTKKEKSLTKLKEEQKLIKEKFISELTKSKNYADIIKAYENILKNNPNKKNILDLAAEQVFRMLKINKITIEDIDPYCKEKDTSIEAIAKSIEKKEINLGPFGILILDLYNKQKIAKFHKKISLLNIPNGIEANSLHEFPNAVSKAIELLEEANEAIELLEEFNPATKAIQLFEEFNANDKKSKILIDLCNLYETLHVQIKVGRWDNPDQSGKMYIVEELQEPWKQFDLWQLESLRDNIGDLNKEMEKKIGAEAFEAAQKIMKGLDASIQQKKEITPEQNKILQKLMKSKNFIGSMDIHENILKKSGNEEDKLNLNKAFEEYLKISKISITDLNEYFKEKGTSIEEIVNIIKNKKVNLGAFEKFILNLYNKSKIDKVN